MLLPYRLYLLIIAAIPAVLATPRPQATQLESVPNYDRHDAARSSQAPPIAYAQRDVPWGLHSSVSCGCDRPLDINSTVDVMNGLLDQTMKGGFKVAVGETWTMFSDLAGVSNDAAVVMFVDNHGFDTYTLSEQALRRAFDKLTEFCGKFVAGSVGMLGYTGDPDMSHAIGYMRAVDFDKQDVRASIWAGTNGGCNGAGSV